MAQFNTKSGLTPDESRLPYRITTDAVKKYLQDSFNALVLTARKKGIKMDDIDIQLYSYGGYSKKFIPFVLMLPLSVLDSKPNRDDSNDILVACGEKPQNVIRINHHVYKLLQAYCYDESDKRYFRNNDQFRRMYGLTHQKSIELARNASPKIQTFDNGRLRYVAVTIDPIRVFYDMLAIPEDGKKYSIQITDIQKLRKASHNYTVIRSNVKPNSSKESDIIIAELERNAGR